jgi:hypothetical protein
MLDLFLSSVRMRHVDSVSHSVIPTSRPLD